MATSSPLPPIRQNEIEAFLQANPLVRHWLTKWKPITRKLYAIDIIRFQQLSHTQIEQLLLRLENNQIKPREIRSLIETSLANLPNSVQARMDSAVRGFFKHHHGKLPDTTIKYQNNVAVLSIYPSNLSSFDYYFRKKFRDLKGFDPQQQRT